VAAPLQATQFVVVVVMHIASGIRTILYCTTQIRIAQSGQANQKRWGRVIAIAYVSYAAANSSDFKQRLKLLKVFKLLRQWLLIPYSLCWGRRRSSHRVFHSRLKTHLFSRSFPP